MSQLLEFATNHWILVLAFLIILALLVRSFLSDVASGVKKVKVSEAVNLVNREGARVVDVRTEAEYKNGHILDSLNLPLGILEQNIKRLGEDKDRPLVVVCRSGQRSTKAAQLLKRHGFTRIYNLAGGILAWEKEGLPLHREKKKKAKKGKKKGD